VAVRHVVAAEEAVRVARPIVVQAAWVPASGIVAPLPRLELRDITATVQLLAPELRSGLGASVPLNPAAASSADATHSPSTPLTSESGTRLPGFAASAGAVSWALHGVGLMGGSVFHVRQSADLAEQEDEQ
jgi:hypothetical protein